MKRPDPNDYLLNIGGDFDHINYESDLSDYATQLEKKVSELLVKNASLQLHLNIEIGAKSALCKCSGDMQEIPCDAGEYCMHEQNKPLSEETKKLFKTLGIKK